MERHEIERQGGRTLGRRLTCVCAAILMVATYGLTAVTGTAGAATPLPAPTGLTPNGGDAGPNPVLSWNAVSGAKYYKITHPDQNGNSRTDNVYATSFATTVDYKPGQVSWSVLAVGQDNQNGATASASFTNVAAGGPTMTCPASPVNFPAQSPAFTWTAVEGAKTYKLEVSTTNTFVPASTDTYQTQATSYTLSKGQSSDGQTYYARVSGSTYNNVNTPVSSTCSYKVVWSSGTTNLNDAKVTLQSPTDHAAVRDVILKWKPLEGAARYEVQVSPNGDWTNNLRYDIVTDSTHWSPAKTLDNGAYFWRVRGIDNQDNKSRWSDYPSTSAGDAWQFTVDPLDRPNLVSPDEGASVDNPDLKFTWEPVAGAGAYMVQWADNVGFSYPSQGVALNHTCITNHTDWSPYLYETPPGRTAGPGGNDGCRANRQDQSPDFVDGGVTYWRVRALDDYTQNEVADPWSTGSFNTVNRPPSNGAFISTWSTPRRFFLNTKVPVAQQPANGATVKTPTMSWSRVAGAEYYLVTVQTRSWRWNNGASSCDAPTGGWGTRTYRTSALSFTPSLVSFPRAEHQCPVDVQWTAQSVDWSDRTSAMPQMSSFTWSGFSAGTSSTLTLSAPSPAANAQVQGIPSFAWNPVSGADHYQVWWYDNPNGTNAVLMQDFNSGGNQRDPVVEAFTPVQPLPVGLGAWQIRAFDAQGQQIAVSEKRPIDVIAPDDVQLQSFTTRNQSGAAETCASGCTTPSTPLITWATDPSVSYYRVFIAQDKNFTNLLRVYDTEQNSIRPVEALPDNQAGQSYYVFIQPAIANWYNGANATSTIYGAGSSVVDAAKIWSFHKQSAPITGMKTLTPTSTAKSPSTSACDDASGTSTISDVTTFCWNASSTVPYSSGDLGAMSYHIQVSTTADFSNIIDQAWVDQPSYTPYAWPQSANGGYSPRSVITPPSSQSIRDMTYPDGPIYWRVQAVDASSNALTYSATQSVTKDSTAVTVTTPTNEASVGSTPSLSWNTKPLVAQYQVQVAANGDTNFSSANLKFNQFTDLTSITPSNNNSMTNGLSLPVGTYAWRVRGVDANGNSGAWSAVRTFVVSPAAASLTNPANNARFSALSDLTFRWNTVEGAVRYRIRLGQSNPPTSISVDTVSNAWSLDRQIANGTWYWQVQSLDAQNQVLASSSVRSFTVLGTRPTVTNMRATASVYKAIDLSWGSSNDPTVGPITGFTINRYSSSTAPTPSATRNVSASTSTYRWTDLDANTRYYFTVTANDQYGPGLESNRVTAIAPGYSNVQSFVYAAYNDFLGHNPNSTQLNNAVRDLGPNPTASKKAAWLQALANSPAWVNAIVNQFYLDTLGRTGDPGGVSYWSGQISSRKKTVAEVAANFYASDEYFNGQYGKSNLTTWVTDLYSKILTRDPDSGVSYWVSMVSVHANPNAFAGRVWVAYNFYQSQESREKRVTDLYLKLLHRGPDPGGRAFWATRILSTGDIALAVDLASSDEYYSRAHTRYPG